MRRALGVAVVTTLVCALLGLGFAAGSVHVIAAENVGITLAVTSALRGGVPEHRTVSNAYNGDVVLENHGVACEVQHRANTTFVRCEHGGQWSSVLMHCEAFAVGSFARTYGMRFGAADGSAITEIEFACRYKRTFPW